jgi:hypothetical protein
LLRRLPPPPLTLPPPPHRRAVSLPRCHHRRTAAKLPTMSRCRHRRCHHCDVRRQATSRCLTAALPPPPRRRQASTNLALSRCHHRHCRRRRAAVCWLVVALLSAVRFRHRMPSCNHQRSRCRPLSPINCLPPPPPATAAAAGPPAPTTATATTVVELTVVDWRRKRDDVGRRDWDKDVLLFRRWRSRR